LCDLIMSMTSWTAKPLATGQSPWSTCVFHTADAVWMPWRCGCGVVLCVWLCVCGCVCVFGGGGVLSFGVHQRHVHVDHHRPRPPMHTTHSTARAHAHMHVYSAQHGTAARVAVAKAHLHVPGNAVPDVRVVHGPRAAALLQQPQRGAVVADEEALGGWRGLEGVLGALVARGHAQPGEEADLVVCVCLGGGGVGCACVAGACMRGGCAAGCAARHARRPRHTPRWRPGGCSFTQQQGQRSTHVPACRQQHVLLRAHTQQACQRRASCRLAPPPSAQTHTHTHKRAHT
jgi:hypothetical protein